MPRLTLLAGLLLCSGLLHAAPTVSQLQDGLEHQWSLAWRRDRCDARSDVVLATA